MELVCRSSLISLARPIWHRIWKRWGRGAVWSTWRQWVVRKPASIWPGDEQTSPDTWQHATHAHAGGEDGGYTPSHYTGGASTSQRESQTHYRTHLSHARGCAGAPRYGREQKLRQADSRHGVGADGRGERTRVRSKRVRN